MDFEKIQYLIFCFFERVRCTPPRVQSSEYKGSRNNNVVAALCIKPWLEVMKSFDPTTHARVWIRVQLLSRKPNPGGVAQRPTADLAKQLILTVQSIARAAGID